MIVIYIIFLIIWLCTLLGWITESIYRKLLIKNIKKSFLGKIEWLEKSHDENKNVKIATWKKALEIIKKAEGK